MPTIDDSSWRRLSALAIDAFALRDLMHQNAWDHEVRKTVEFVFLVDPDVVELYTKPGGDRWTRSLSAFPSLLGDELESDEAGAEEDEERSVSQTQSFEVTMLRANALLTGEFIFSPNFVRPWKYLFVAPEHTPELIGHMARIARRTSGVAPAAAQDVFGRIHHELRAQHLVLKEGRIRAVDYVSRSNTIIARNLAAISHDNLLAKHRLEHLLSKDILSGVDDIEEFTPDIVAPSMGEVDKWAERIRAAKSHHRKQPTQDALEADAVTLTQLLKLNEGWREKRRAFVLITRDQGMHSAFARWRWREGQGGDEDMFNPLRQPRQYMPILNINSMGGATKGEGAFDRLKVMVDDLTATFTSNEDMRGEFGQDGSSALRIVLNRIRTDARHADLVVIVDERIKEILRLWNESLEAVISAKSDTIVDLARAQEEYWSRLFKQSALPQKMRDRLERLNEGFLRVQTSSTYLRHEIVAIEAASSSEDAEDFGQRALISSFSDFKSAQFLGKTFDQIVAETRRLKREALEALEETDRIERLAVVGALALDAGAWASAKSLFRRAVRDLRAAGAQNTPFERELLFFEVVTSRLGASTYSWRDDYKQAANVAEHLLRQASLTEFERARVLGERMALWLCNIAWEVDQHRTGPAQIESMCREAIELLRTYRTAAEGLDVAEAAAARLEKQVLLNTLDLFFWASHAGCATLDINAYAGRALQIVSDEKWQAENAGVHSLAYPAMARWAFARGKQRAAEVDRIVELLQAAVSKDRSRGIYIDLPPTDHAEFRAVQSVVRPMR